MRVTSEVKQLTQERILAAARKLLSRDGFEKTTTRDIAQAAKVATGTVFNYFSTKEAMALHLIDTALEEADVAFAQTWNQTHGAGGLETGGGPRQSLEEDLFRLIMGGLRALEPYRNFVGAVVETSMSPFLRPSQSKRGERLKSRHLEQAMEVIAWHRESLEPSSISMHLYWTLYLGVMAFWSGDPSPHQEDTLAVLDQSLRLFAASLNPELERVRWIGPALANPAADSVIT